MNGMRAAVLAGSLLIAAAACADANDAAGPDPAPAPAAPAGVIAFVSHRDGNPEIYTSNADGTNVVRLTNDPASDSDPAWSPDGKRIAFVSSRAGAEASDIYVMNADATNVVRRTLDGRSWTPAWSPDGTRIAFAAARASNARLIYVMKVDEDWQNPTLVGFANDVDETDPAWSPDGTKVVFSSAGDYTAGFFIANADGSGIRPLLGSIGGAPSSGYLLYNRTAWSPDGARIAVVACSPFPCFDAGNLQIMNTDGSGIATLKPVRNRPRLAWSPDSRTVAFAEPCAGGSPSCRPSIQYIRTDGSAAGVMISDAYSPSWRPDPDALPRIPVASAPAGVVASDPVSSTGRVFVSASRETFMSAAFIGVRNRTVNGSPLPAIVTDGGFDPVGVPGRSGDDIVITLIARNGQPASAMVVKVPPRRPPGIVRTSPSKGRVDVALNVQIEVIFTEPVNPATVNTSSFRVVRGGTAVPGTVSLSADGLTATFTPDDALERLTSYAIEISGSIRDLDGDSLEEPATATFTTADPPVGLVAFVSDRDGNPEIYTASADGTGVTRLTNHPAQDVGPVWSPDGKRIAFASDRSGEFARYVMNADGTNVVRKTTNSVHGARPAWSPDGKLVAYTAFDDDGGSIRIADAEGDWSSSVGYGPGQYSYSTDPTWSPDGKRIAFASDWNVFDGQQIFSMNADGTGVRVLLQATAKFSSYDVGEIYFQPAWSPDGRRLAVVACHFAPHNCYPYSTVSIINADGSGLTTLKFAGGEARPAWSPDGQFIAFSSASCYVCPRSIRYVRVDGSNAGITDDVLIADGYSPAWKPSAVDK